jgi:hypothetical protein
MTHGKCKLGLARFQAEVFRHPSRWALLSLSGSLLGFLLTFGGPLSWAVQLHAYAGYYFCLILFIGLLYSTWGVLQTLNLRGYLSRHKKGLLLVLFASVFVHLFQPHMMRVYNDEPAHQMVAKVMHLERENSVPEAGYALSGGLEYGERSLNYRMYFYPFLVSIIHDLTGFRPINGLLLNGFIGAAFFFVLYLCGNRIYSDGGGVLAVLLMLSLPLLDETVTSYSYDITNLFFLAALFLGLSLYAEYRSPVLLNWSVMLAIGLAYSRNESVIYLVAVMLVFGLLLLRDPNVTLTRIVACSPFLLLPVISARRIFHEIMQSLPAGASPEDGSPLFALHYIPDNFIRVASWMFDFSSTVPSSPILALVGSIGLLALLVACAGAGARRRESHPCDWVLGVFAMGIFCAFALITLAFFWNPVSGEAVRFLLPIHLLFTLATVWFVANTTQPKRNFPITFALVGIAIFLISIPTKTRQVRAENLVFAKYADWAIDWIKEHKHEGHLYVSQLNTLFLLHGHPTIGLAEGSSNIERLGQLIAEGYYKEILVFIIERYDPVTATWAPAAPASPLDQKLITEVVEEQRWAFNQRMRFLRVTGFRNSAGEAVYWDRLRPLKNDFNNFSDYWNAMLKLHPGLGRN